jgi:hypothetical protein
MSGEGGKFGSSIVVSWHVEILFQLLSSSALLFVE